MPADIPEIVQIPSPYNFDNLEVDDYTVDY